MLLIKRLWLLPSVAIVLFLYYFFYASPSPVREPIYHYDDDVRLQIRPERYPVQSFSQLPTGLAGQLPRIQHVFDPETAEQKQERKQRQLAVKEAFLHTWAGYTKYAWMQDEIAPLSGAFRNPFGGWAASLVDAMGTLWIMGLKDDFEACVRAIQKIDFTTNTEETVNVFETTIRYLGGFLSAYDISEHKYPVILAKAIELANILYIAFDTPNRLPVTRWKWRDSARGMPLRASQHTLLAELGSMTLEFTRLAQLTGEPKWYDAVDRITDLLHRGQGTTKVPGLWPTLVDAANGEFPYNHFTLGGMADSTAEYLPKEYMLLGGLDPRYRTMYDRMITAAEKHLFYRPLVPGNHNILFSGNTGLNDQGQVATELQGQHLTCFASGMVGIAAKLFDRPDDMRVARQLVDGCIWAYNSTPTGLMPETFHMASCQVGAADPIDGKCEWSETKWFEAVARQQESRADASGQSLAASGKLLVEQQSLLPGYTRWGDNRYILRPEAIESVFITYRLTGDRTYLDTAWTMWNSITAACKTPLAFAGVSDVRVNPPHQSDRMESFWLAETLKYFYLIFSDPHDWSLDDWVLTTEAHFLQRPKPGQPLTAQQG